MIEYDDNNAAANAFNIFAADPFDVTELAQTIVDLKKKPRSNSLTYAQKYL